MTAIPVFFHSLWSISSYTWREGMRKKILIGFLILSLLTIFGATFLTAFLETGGTGADAEVDAKLVKDICVTAISIFGVLITIFISASVVPSEVENKVIYTVLSKPVRRYQYLLGKFLGVQLIVLMNLALMGGLFFVALYFQEGILPTLLLWTILLTYFEFIVVSGFTFAVSCAATSPVLPTIAGLFIYITGHLTEYLYDVYTRAGQTGEWGDQVIGQIAYGLWLVLPNLQNFNMRSQLLHLQPNDPPADIMIPNLILYALLFVVAGLGIAYWIFRRKEL